MTSDKADIALVKVGEVKLADRWRKLGEDGEKGQKDTAKTVQWRYVVARKFADVVLTSA